MRKTSAVFWASLAVVLPVVVWGALGPGSLAAASEAARDFLVHRFGWFYLLAATLILISVIVLAASRYGKIRLGQDDDEPEYGTGAWFAMLFAAGMGIGMVFWGVAEPVSHYLEPAAGEAASNQAARDALRYSFFHWGLHPWAIYSLLALALGYARYRRGWKATVSGALRPVLGDRVDGPIGTAVDTLAVAATVFGVATSLGLGAAQVNGGLEAVSGGAIETGPRVQLAIIAIVTVVFMLSALSGLQRGIKWLSSANGILAIVLFAFILFAGPTSRLFGAFTTTLGSYITELPAMSLQTGPFDSDRSEWINEWTIFYWAWWISWSPFVATFIARISRGRTIREFVVGVLGVPTLVGGAWFTVFGSAGILAERDGAGLGELATESQLFGLFDTLPFTLVAGIAAMLLVITFFVTSADSATFVLGSLSTKGGADPSRSVTVVWGLVISASAAVLLFSGGLEGLQTAAILAAFPFVIVLLLALVSLYRGLREEPGMRRQGASAAADRSPSEPAAGSTAGSSAGSTAGDANRVEVP